MLDGYDRQARGCSYSKSYGTPDDCLCNEFVPKIVGTFLEQGVSASFRNHVLYTVLTYLQVQSWWDMYPVKSALVSPKLATKSLRLRISELR